jgi:hypothetical protein
MMFYCKQVLYYKTAAIICFTVMPLLSTRFLVITILMDVILVIWAVTIEEGERQVKVLIKNLAIFFLFPSKGFLPI